MALLLDIGATGQKTYWALRAAATGLNLTGITPSLLTCAYTRIGTAAGDAVTTFAVSAMSAVSCNWSSGKAIEVDSTNAKGLVRVDFPDAAFASGVDLTVLSCSYGSTSFTEHKEVQFRVPVSVKAMSADAVTSTQSGLATPTNITAGTITTVTNLTNLPAITADWLTATGVKADAVTKIQNGLATPTNITAGTIARVTLVDTCTTNTDMRGTNSAALASVCTEARLAELDAANLPTATDEANAHAHTIDGIVSSATKGVVKIYDDMSKPATAQTITAPADMALNSTVAKDATVAKASVLGAAVGASISADIAAVKSDSAAILTDTGTTLDALIKDIPTVAEFETRTLVAADYVVVGDTIAGVTAVTNTVNADVKKVNGTTITGDGSVATPWGPA
jgi:hypothetical protein